MEKETLEEAIDRISKEDKYDIEGGKVADFVDGIMKGVKWQQEKSYSEEDMINFAFDTYCYISGIMKVPFNQVSENKLHAIENLKQFKKK